MRSTSVAKVVAVIAAVGLAAGCGSGADDDTEAGDSLTQDDGAAEEPADAPAGDGSAGDNADTAEAAAGESAGQVVTEAISAVDGRDIIYTIDLSMEVEDVARAARETATITMASGGFVAAEETTREEDFASLTLKIPVDVQAETLDKVENLGEVSQRTRETRDVTQEVVDVESRIASQRASITRIRALLDDATKIEQIIDIETELAEREADLDALLSRQEELSALTSMATVAVTFHKSDVEVTAAEDEDEQGFLVGLRNGWDGFAAFVTVLLTAVGAVLPFAVAAGLLAVPAWYIRRARKGAGATPAPVSPPE